MITTISSLNSIFIFFFLFSSNYVNSFNFFNTKTSTTTTIDGNLIPSLSETINLNTMETTTMKQPYNSKIIQFNTSYMTRQHPYVINIPGQRTTACAAKFRSLSSRSINMWWEDGQGGLFQGTLQPGQESTTNTYEGHIFFFTDKNNKNDVISRILIKKEVTLYPIEDVNYPAKQEIIEQTKAEVAYNEEYLKKTNGIQWRHYYGPNGPRSPPVLYMLPAHQIGQQHTVTTAYNHW